jgi:hypothetical protein
MMAYRVVEFLLEDGSSPYAEWFTSLDPIAVAKLRIEQGNLSNVERLLEVSVSTRLIGDQGIGFISPGMDHQLLYLWAEEQRKDNRKISNGPLTCGKVTSGEKEGETYGIDKRFQENGRCTS